MKNGLPALPDIGFTIGRHHRVLVGEWRPGHRLSRMNTFTSACVDVF
jgi:hypothetical protein